ncbi:MAG: LL-diaminopimelate aminotransferase [Acutalibacteraceae bacterium]|nr:LL-diaminopimelate aminotransferase [Acutalibacteraceae bacterium]
MKINHNFDNLVPNYLFADIAKKSSEYAAAHPDKPLIRMGIGDVTLPLPKVAVDALKKGAEDLAHKESFKGYPDYEGYDFVREAISKYYASFGVTVSADEILVTDGAKGDSANLSEIFSQDSVVLVTDPVYPVYVDSNIMAGRKILYAPSNEENGFCAAPDESVHADLIYLCSPNNPTGAAFSKDQLKAWVDYANKEDAVIIYDAAYEHFIVDDSPRSIFAIEGARTCAIEICSMSKTAGFTGTRGGYTVIPKELVRDGHNIYDLWYRRLSTKYNGVSWPVQCAIAAIFSEQGMAEIDDNINYYRENASTIMATLDKLGIEYTGGKNSPYVWMKCPKGMGSWEFFDYILEEIQVVGTPGEGFGDCGKGWFRFTSFGSHENTVEAMKRMEKLLG